ncbi:MAG: MFS transporter [Burkholderiaceae bacterium]|nr:MFS transporter [Burkholderiaceae bacterium]
MTKLERRSSVSLASIFALRMFGLFLILPVFAVYARGIPGGDDAALVGLALGIYGLTQALLQLPFGMASDRWGRKPVIVAGLLLFALGSFVAAVASGIVVTIIGRALQGAGAISAAVTAFVADSTRDSQRTKAMAMVGGSIGFTFALSLVGAPLLYQRIGMGGIFAFTGVLAIVAILVVVFVVPPVPRAVIADASRTPLRDVVREPDLLRLNFGIFSLHAVQMAMFVVLPTWLADRAGIPVSEHWKIYLPVVVLSFLLMLPPLFWSERRGRLRVVFLASIAMVLVVQLALVAQPSGLPTFALLLLVFFAGFNVLEASLPSMISRLAPVDAKGTALGVYNTTQSFGLFFGGAIGGWVQQVWGRPAVFVACAVLMALWLVVASGHRRWPRSARAAARAASASEAA